MVNIILDTNFLLIPGQFGVDIFAEIARVCDFPHSLCIIDRTVDELQAIAATHGKDAAAAKVALQLLAQKSPTMFPSNGKGVDAAILAHAAPDWIVGTQDGALRQQLRSKNIRLLTMRGKSHLTIA